MILNKKVVVVMPAYNAEKTLERTVELIPLDMLQNSLSIPYYPCHFHVWAVLIDIVALIQED